MCCLTNDAGFHRDPPPPPSLPQDAATRRGGELPRILLVEDDPSTVELMQRLLTRSGYDVRSAASYTEALHTATEWLPDLLISDLALPGKSGLQVLTMMREAYPGLKGIVVSGYTSAEDKERSRAAGFAEHLGKPVNIAQLTDTIRRLLIK